MGAFFRKLFGQTFLANFFIGTFWATFLGALFGAHFVEIFGEPWPLQEAARPHCQSHPAPPPPTPSPQGWPGQRVNHIGWKRKRTLECHFTCSKGTAPGVIRTLPAARSQCWPPAPPPPPPQPTGPPWQPGQRVNQKPTKQSIPKFTKRTYSR